jgi:hypothetical protein
MALRDIRGRVVRRDSDFWTGLFLMIFSGAVARGAYKIGLGSVHVPGPGFMFFGTSILLGFLSLYLVLKSLLTGEPKGGENVWRGKRLGQAVSFFVALGFYNFFLNFFGYLLATFSLLVFLFWVTGERKKGEWFLILGGSALTSFIAYLVFSRWFLLMFPKGLIRFF